MGYDLTLFQKADVVSRFYGGASLRRISLDFRNAFGLPISPATILRRVFETVKSVDNTVEYLMRIERTETVQQHKFGFTPVLGDIWEIDEVYITLEGKDLPLIVVKDLKTCFIVAAKLARSVTIKAVTEALICAREKADKYPKELRGDGHRSYPKAVKRAFGYKTKLIINKKIGPAGQDQSIESTFGNAIRSRTKRMKSFHSWDKSPVIIRGLILDYNFARPCEALNGKTPAESAMAWKPIDGKRGWPALLRLAEYYAKRSRTIKKKDKVKTKIQRQVTFDELTFTGRPAKKGHQVTVDRRKQLQLSSFLI